MGDSKELNILAISDLHYIGKADHVCNHEKRHNSLGALAVRKALRRLQWDNLSVDLIILLGDLVDNGEADGAREDLKSLAAEIKQLDKPVLAVNGNHDGSATSYSDCFDCPEGIYYFGGYGFLVFNDDVAEGDFVTRPQRYFDVLRQQPEDTPIVALQHNPVYPEIDSKYPYVLTNAEDVRAAYTDSPVFFSLSGHYHRGQEAATLDGVVYRTLPALCEAPFRFDYIQLREVLFNPFRTGSR